MSRDNGAPRRGAGPLGLAILTLVAWPSALFLLGATGLLVHLGPRRDAPPALLLGLLAIVGGGCLIWGLRRRRDRPTTTYWLLQVTIVCGMVGLFLFSVGPS